MRAEETHRVKPEQEACPTTDREARLSRRQKEILALVAEGATDSEIAQRLCLTPGTVRWYVREILLRMGARCRAHAVALALRQGTLEDGNAEGPSL